MTKTSSKKGLRNFLLYCQTDPTKIELNVAHWVTVDNTGVTVVIRWLRPEFKFPAKIEMAYSQILAIRRWFN